MQAETIRSALETKKSLPPWKSRTCSSVGRRTEFCAGATQRALCILLFSVMAAMFLTGAAVAQQNQILLEATEVGGTVEVEIAIDFSDEVLGGGLAVSYDSARLQFASFQFDPTGPTHFLDGPLAGETNQPLAIGGGWLTLQPPYKTGLQVFGTATFNRVSAGETVISASNGTVAHGVFQGPNGALVLLDGMVTLEAPSAPGAPPPAVPSFGSYANLFILLGLLALLGYRAQMRGPQSA